MAWPVKLPPRRARSVRKDWFAALPGGKQTLFDSVVGELEGWYGMLSVALDESFALRKAGSGLAAVQADLSAQLFERLATHLLATLRALEDHGRHFGTLPTVASLNAEFFRGDTAQRAARKNHLLHTVLFSSRSRFFHKLRSLAETLEDLQEEFCGAGQEIAEGCARRAAANWEILDSRHYDLNTCLRETTVILKSFLCVLPSEQVQLFARALQTAAFLPLRKAAVAVSGDSR